MYYDWLKKNILRKWLFNLSFLLYKKKKFFEKHFNLPFVKIFLFLTKGISYTIINVFQGVIQHQGTFNSLVKSNFDFAKLFESDEDETFPIEEKEKMEVDDTVVLVDKALRQISTSSTRSNRVRSKVFLNESSQSVVLHLKSNSILFLFLE